MISSEPTAFCYLATRANVLLAVEQALTHVKCFIRASQALDESITICEIYAAHGRSRALADATCHLAATLRALPSNGNFEGARDLCQSTKTLINNAVRDAEESRAGKPRRRVRKPKSAAANPPQEEQREQQEGEETQEQTLAPSEEPNIL